MQYDPNPQFKVKYGSTEYENDSIITGTITRVENGFDTANLIIDDVSCKYYPSTVTAGTAIEISFKDASEAVWTKVFDGVVRIAVPRLSKDGELTELKCDGAGYGIAESAVGQEYGNKSNNPTLDTIPEILTDATDGVLPVWVNKVLGTATDSGYSYTHDVENFTGTIRYIDSPYKPASKFIDDLCDLGTALKAGGAGPHWRVTVDDKFLLKKISNADTEWDKYYANTQAKSTLTQGMDFTTFRFQKMEQEANYILYYGKYVKPTHERWTEGADCETFWAKTLGSGMTLTDNNVEELIGDYCLEIDVPDASVDVIRAPPGDQAWDITKWGGFYNIPWLSIYTKFGAFAPASITVRMCTNAANYFQTSLGPSADWEHWQVPLGPYWHNSKLAADSSWRGWTGVGGGEDWADIDYVGLDINGTIGNDAKMYVDGFEMYGWLLRAATRDYGATPFTALNPVKIKTIVDDVAKDDSGKAADDSGTIAQLAYAEFLRCSTTPTVGTVTLPTLLKDALPGHWFHIDAKPDAAGTYQIDADHRTPKLVHTFGKQGYGTTLTLTSDLNNSHPRLMYDDYNKVIAVNRPNFQDRQATNMKAMEIDITQEILETQY